MPQANFLDAKLQGNDLSGTGFVPGEHFMLKYILEASSRTLTYLLLRRK